MTRDQRRARQGAPRPDRRGDDGLQARAPGDRRATSRRPARCSARGAWRPPASAPGARRPRASSAYTSTARVGSIVGVGCETEPVSRNEEFQAFGETCCAPCTRTARTRPTRSRTERVELIGKLGENIVVAGAERLEGGDGEVLAGYVHPPANKIGVLVQLDGGTPELARQLAMHISFAAPEWTTRDDVPADVVAAERQIYVELGRGAVEAGGGA